jgi:heme A synthase
VTVVLLSDPGSVGGAAASWEGGAGVVGSSCGRLALLCVAALVSGGTNLFLKLSVADVDDPKALRDLRCASVIWYLARVYLGSPRSGRSVSPSFGGVPLSSIFVLSSLFLLVGSRISF